MGTELIVGFGGRCWRCPLSRGVDVKEEWGEGGHFHTGADVRREV